MEPRTLIFVNGLLPNPAAARALVQPGDILLAADGGTRHVLALGLMPGAVIGDLDSLPPADRLKVEAAGVPRRDFPRDKNETDLALALQVALQSGGGEIVIVAALGGRLDQALGNLCLLADPRLAQRRIRLDDGIEQAFFIHSDCRLFGMPGDLVSLIPWGVPAVGVRTQELRWSLHGETLQPFETRGISNEMLAESAGVQIESGLLLLVHRRMSVRL